MGFVSFEKMKENQDIRVHFAHTEPAEKTPKPKPKLKGHGRFRRQKGFMLNSNSLSYASTDPTAGPAKPKPKLRSTSVGRPSLYNPPSPPSRRPSAQTDFKKENRKKKISKPRARSLPRSSGFQNNMSEKESDASIRRMEAKAASEQRKLQAAEAKLEAMNERQAFREQSERENVEKAKRREVSGLIAKRNE